MRSPRTARRCVWAAVALQVVGLVS